MAQSIKTRQCPGCRAIFPYQEDLDHYATAGIARYGVTSPECAAALYEILTKEGQNYGYPPAHRLVIDAYAAQHPPHQEHQLALDIDKRLIDASIQSVAIHLIALYLALEKKMALLLISKKMDYLLSKGIPFEQFQLTSSIDLGKVRAIDIKNTLCKENLSLEQYTALAWKWADSAWSAWALHHETVRHWYEKYSI